jgi:hypothetical protein
MFMVEGGRDVAGRRAGESSLEFRGGTVVHVAPAGQTKGTVVHVAPGGQLDDSNLHDSAPLAHGLLS